MNITLVAVGKLKDKYLKDGIGEYSKRLGRFCRFEIIEVRDEKAPENMSEKEMEAVKKKEGESIAKYFKEGVYKIALCIEGSMKSSTELSQMIRELEVRGTSSIMFIIGGSLGLSQEIIDSCDFRLSFSRMTFPHPLMRLILAEQIYRSFKIMNNETYHK